MCSFTRKCLWTQALSSNCQHLRESVKSHSSTDYIKCYNMCQVYAKCWEHRNLHIHRARPHGAAFLQKRYFASEKSNQTPGSLTRVRRLLIAPCLLSPLIQVHRLSVTSSVLSTCLPRVMGGDLVVGQSSPCQDCELGQFFSFLETKMSSLTIPPHNR